MNGLEITWIELKLGERPPFPSPEPGRRTVRVLAYAAVTFNGCFCVQGVRWLQSIDSGRDYCFAAMPHREHQFACPGCHTRNSCRAKFCNGCGASLLDKFRGVNVPQPFLDQAHPLTPECRAWLERAIKEKYEKVLGTYLYYQPERS